MITHYYLKLIKNLFDELNLKETLTYKIDGVGTITLTPEGQEVVATPEIEKPQEAPVEKPVETPQETPVEETQKVKPSKKKEA